MWDRRLVGGRMMHCRLCGVVGEVASGESLDDGPFVNAAFPHGGRGLLWSLPVA